MRRTITCGVNSGGIVIANYDVMEEYFDSMGMRHMDSLYSHCIEVGLAKKVVVDISFAEKGVKTIRKLRMNGDGSQATSILQGGIRIIAGLNVGPSGMIFIADPSQYCVEKAKDFPLFPLAANYNISTDMEFREAHSYPVASEGFYQFDVEVSDAR